MASDATPTGLELATTDELVCELQKRMPQLIVAGLEPPSGGERNAGFRFWWRGGYTTAIGLAARARRLLMRWADEDEG